METLKGNACMPGVIYVVVLFEETSGDVLYCFDVTDNT